MKTIIFHVRSRPDNPELGYGDLVQVFDGDNNLYGGHASTCPNPYKTLEIGRKPWGKLYGWIDNQTTTFECVEHHKFGKCLLVNGGFPVASRVPNPNHGGAYIITEVFVHSGGHGCNNKRWRGSAGCLTIPPEDWDNFISLFEIGEKGHLTIKPYMENR